jgi:hypothetical protein
MTAECTPVGLKQPLESCLHDVSSVCASIIDRSAVRTARGEETDNAAHGATSSSTVPLVPAPTRCGDGVSQNERWPVQRPPTARLASRAAVRCSGVLRSGSDRLLRAARETWRLWRFRNLLFIVSFTQVPVCTPISPIPPQPRRSWPRSSASARLWKRHSEEPCESPWWDRSRRPSPGFRIVRWRR